MTGRRASPILGRFGVFSEFRESDGRPTVPAPCARVGDGTPLRTVIDIKLPTAPGAARFRPFRALCTWQSNFRHCPYCKVILTEPPNISRHSGRNDHSCADHMPFCLTQT